MARLIANFDICTNCKTCEIVCSLEKFGGFNANKGLLFLDEDPLGFSTQPVVCAQCENPFCQKVCPTGAIKRDSETGALVIDKEVCIGCGRCAESCPLGVIRRKDDVFIKCDLCGGDPLCVKSCPTGALKFIEFKSEEVKKR